MKIIDTHCHLVSEKLKDDFENILLRAKEAHVEKIINVAYNWETSLLVLEQIKRSQELSSRGSTTGSMHYPLLYGAVGIQPHDVHEYTEALALKIQNLILEDAKLRSQLQSRIVAIGEIGLDAYLPQQKETLKKQMVCFEHFLNMACEKNISLPVIVHVRETHNESRNLIAQYAKHGLRGVIHCFTGTEEEARQFLDCGFFISFSGIVTFKNAQALADVAAFVPSDRILIETDSPYLAPVPMRGKINEPSYLKNTCEFLANKRGVSVEEFARQTYHNSHLLFGL